MHSACQTVHAVLVLRQSRQNSRAAGRTATDGRVPACEYETALGQRVKVRGLDVGVAVDGHLEAAIV